MSVRAKFKVISITTSEHWDKDKSPLSTVCLYPVTANNPENEQFYAATPSGKIELGTLNASAAAAFQLGGEYYVDFTSVVPVAQ